MEKIMRRKVDPLGRIILPAEFRTRLGIEKDSEIEIVCEKDRMIIKKVSPMGVIIPLPRDQKSKAGGGAVPLPAGLRPWPAIDKGGWFV